MKTPIFYRIIAIIALMTTGAFAAPRVSAAPRWFYISSEHFELYSCTSKSESIEMLVQLEQFRLVFLKLFAGGNSYEKNVQMFVFDGSNQMQPYVPLYKGKPEKIGGLFSEGSLESKIEYVNEDIEAGLRAIFHEYVHSLIAAQGWKPPLFFNEGLAEAYSTFQASGDKITLGLPIQYHILALHDDRFIPFDTFFKVGHSSPYYGSSPIIVGKD